MSCLSVPTSLCHSLLKLVVTPDADADSTRDVSIQRHTTIPQRSGLTRWSRLHGLLSMCVSIMSSRSTAVGPATKANQNDRNAVLPPPTWLKRTSSFVNEN